MKKEIKEKTVSELFQLVYIAMEFENTPKEYGTDVCISSAEIYQLKCISDRPKANITVLAEILGISKSAVSQSVKKLKAKDLVDIEIDDENHSRYIINLTQKGKIAHEEHMNRRNDLFSKISRVLDNSSEDMCEEIFSFLQSSKDILKDFV